MTEDGILTYLACLITLVAGVAAWDTCPYNGILGPDTMKCLHGCCGSTFDDACCDAPNIGLIVGAVVGSIIFLVFIGMMICFCCACNRGWKFRGSQGFGTRTPVGQPYTVYPHGAQTTVPPGGVHASSTSTAYVSTGGAPTPYSATTYASGSATTGTVYPPQEMQHSNGYTETGFSSKESFEPRAPTEPSAPPSYSAVMHPESKFGGQ